MYSEALMDPVTAPRQAFLSVFLLIVHGFIFFKKSFKNQALQSSRLSLLLISANAVLVGLSIASTAYAHVVSESMYVASKYGILLVFFLTTYFLLSAQLLFRKDLVNGVLIFCIISLCYGIYDMVMLWSGGFHVLTHSVLITATYANKNLFASVLFLCIWAAFAATLPSVIRLVLILILSAFILFLQSKIVVFVTACLFLTLAIKNRPSFSKQKKSIWIGALFITALLLSVLFNFNRFVNLASLHTLDTRFAMWTNSFQMFAEKPFGVGAGNWQVFFSKYGLAHFDLPEVRNGTTMGRQPHNDFIWMLCELGIQGLAVYLGVFILLFIIQIRSVRKSNDTFSFLLLVTSAGYCLVAFFDFPLERMEHQILVSVILALSMHHYDSVCKDSIHVKPSNYLSLCLLVICVSGVISYYRLQGEYYTRTALSLNRKKYPELVVENCDKARSAFYNIDPVAIPVDWYAGMALLSAGNTNAAKLRMEKALEYTPYNIRILNRLAALYAKEGNREKAVSLYTKALVISPTATIAPINKKAPA
jgi:O-antigen ligase